MQDFKLGYWFKKYNLLNQAPRHMLFITWNLLLSTVIDLDGFKLDVFGNGEDAYEVQSAAKRLDLNLNFQKGRDHADDSLHG